MNPCVIRLEPQVLRSIHSCLPAALPTGLRMIGVVVVLLVVVLVVVLRLLSKRS